MPIERNMIRKLLNILAVVALLAGCGTEVEDMPEKVGYLAVDLSYDYDTQTKAEDVNPADFDIIISGPVNITSKCADLPEIIELAPGTYIVSVQSPEDEPAAFDQPIYGCSASFDIVEGATTSVKLICTLLNIKFIFVKIYCKFSILGTQGKRYIPASRDRSSSLPILCAICQFANLLRQKQSVVPIEYRRYACG